MALDGVEIRLRPRQPRTRLRILRHDKTDAGAFKNSTILLQEDTTCLHQAGDVIPARLVELKRFQQAQEQRRTQMRLLLHERIEQGELVHGRIGNPRLELLRRTQRVSNALVEMLANEVFGDLAVEYDRRGILRIDQRRADGG